MRSERIDNREEREVLVGMITSNVLLAKVAPKWGKDGLFLSPFSNVIGGLCVSYHRKYRSAPNRNITSLFGKWAEGKGEDTIKAIDRLLSSLSDGFEQTDEGDDAHLVEVAERHFNKVKMGRLLESVNQEHSNGRLTEAQDALKLFTPIRLGGARCVTATEIAVRSVSWLWKPWLAFGEIAVLDGIPGEGKSLLTLDVVARVTRGWHMPPFPRSGRNDVESCLIVANEDSWEHTIVPRLTAAGADLHLVYKLPSDYVTFPADIGHLEEIVRKTKVVLLVIDPIMGCVGDAKMDTNAEAHVRRFLAPILELTRKHSLATILVRHFKKEGGSAIHRGIGSQAWTAFCRLQHAVGKRNPDAAEVVLAPSKNNLARKPKSLGFVVDDATIPGKHGEITTARIEWKGEVEVTADDVAATGRRGRGRPSRQEEVKDLIATLLERADGSMDADTLERRVRGETGCSESTFHTAKRGLGIKSRREGGMGGDGKWVSHLPD